MSAIKNEKIIEAVRNYRCLYDSRDPKYPDKVHKDKLWEKISEEVNVPVKDCRIRWKSLRDRYRREKTNEHRPGQKKWRYKPLMEFLSQSLKPPNINIVYKAETIDQSTSSSKTIDATWQDEQAIAIENIQEVSWIPVDEGPSSPPPPTVDKSRRNDPLIREVLLAMKKKYDDCALNQNSKYGNFLGMVSDKLDKLAPADADDAQIEILQLLNRKINTPN